jgi:hypothetical protein
VNFPQKEESMKTFHRTLWIAGLVLLCVTGVSAAEMPQPVDLPEAQLTEAGSCLEAPDQGSAVAPDVAAPAGEAVPLTSVEKCIEGCLLQYQACCNSLPGICSNLPNPCQTQYFQCSFAC